MTPATHLRLARGPLWLSVGVELLAAWRYLMVGQIAIAGLLIAMTGLLIVLAWVADALFRLLEARIGKALAEFQMAQLAHEQMQRHMTLAQVQSETYYGQRRTRSN
jgi:hypothetical protein